MLIALFVLGGTVFLYARPVASLLETRHELAVRHSEVVGLRAEQARVAGRLQEATGIEALARNARRIGQVHPGEQLFIVKGVDAWRKQHAAAP